MDGNAPAMWGPPEVRDYDMSIRTSSMIFALSIVTLGSVVLSQSASIPNFGETPMFSSATTLDSLTDANVEGLDQRITVQFKEASIADVLKWFTSQRISFVADTSAFRDVRLTVNFTDTPIDEALDSIANMIDGVWERKGSVFTLKSRRSPLVATTAPRLLELPRREGLKLEGSGPMVDINARKLYEKGFAEMGPKGHVWVSGEDGQVKTFGWGDDHDKWYQTDPKTGKTREMTPQERAKFEKEISEMGLKLQKELGDKFKNFKFDMTEEDAKAWEKWGEDFGKKWETWGEEFGKNWEQKFKELEKLDGDHKFMKLDGQKMRELTPAERKQLETELSKIKPMIDRDVKKAMEEAHKAMEEAMKSGKMKNLSDADRAKMEVEMKRLHDEMQKLHSGDMMKLDKEHMLQMKELEKLHSGGMMKLDKDHMLQLKELEKLHKDGAVKVADGHMLHLKELEKLHKDGAIKLDHEHMLKLKELQKLHGDKVVVAPKVDGQAIVVPKVQGEKVVVVPKVQGEKTVVAPKVRVAPPVPAAPKAPMTSTNFKGLLDSLSAAQREKHAKQGYLTPGDLTDTQRKMLGDLPKSGEYTISMTVDGKSLTIKSK